MVDLLRGAITKLVSLVSLVLFHTFARAIMVKIKALTDLPRTSRVREGWHWASPRHAQADIALEGNALLATHGLQIAGIAVDADVAGQLAGDATAAFERDTAVAPCLDGVGVEPDGVEAIAAPPHVAIEIGLPFRDGT